MFIQYFNAMLVRALLLRHHGARVATEQLRCREPMTGRLQLRMSHYEGRDGRGRQVCLLMPPDIRSCQPLVELFSARLLRIEDRGILIGGREEFWDRKRKTEYPQVLWAWPLPPEAAGRPRTESRSPDVVRLREAIEAIS